ncbi:MAG TPA: flagellar hook-associated protein FlgK [Stellaceae bacterium]|nr:flagellar hook-associated protein FlgK [Stellaceae bacterium]
MDNLALSLNTAISGLQAAQSNLSLISANIANAQTAGYTAQYYNQSAELIDGEGAGVSTGVALTTSDPILQASLSQQQSVTSAANTLNNYYQQIQNLFGEAGSAQTIGDSVNSLANALQTLATSPNDTVAQQNVVTAGQQLTTQLNSTSAGIQSIRTSADNAIGTAVTQVNTLLNQVATYNSQIAAAIANGQSTATLEDQRNEAVQQLSQQINVTSYTTSNDNMVVLLAGQTLVNSSAEQLSFTPAGTLSASTPTSGITLNGLNVTSEITGGNIGGLLQMRDQVLPALTQEMNQLATQLYNTGQVATSQTQTISGTAAAGDVLTGNIEGVAFTTAPLTAGTSTAIAAAIQAQFSNYPNIQVTATGANTIEITDAAGNAMSSSVQLTSGTGNETFLASPAANPSSPVQVMSTQTQTVSGTPVVGDTFTATIDGTTVTTAAITAATTTAVAAAIQAALPASLSSIQVTATGSGTIQVTDTQGNPLSSTIAVTTTSTGTETFAAGAPNNPLPTTDSGLSGAAPGDAYHLFSNVNASNSDNAGTIEVNPDLVSNPSLLDGVSTVSSPAIAAALANSIQDSAPTFPATGNFSSPLTMTLNEYAGQILGQNSTAASNASNNAQYQTGVQNQISTSLQNETGVNMDQQLSNLTVYQNSYAASARVVQVVDDMFNSLMQIQP